MNGDLSNWINLVLLIFGFLLLLYSVFFYIRDCKGGISSTMGGDMSFGVYWGSGVMIFSLGIFPMLELSRWWSIAGYLIGMMVSVPLRGAISNVFCVPYKPGPTGFQKFIRKTEKKNADQ